jgi:threonyl-tRNA synthetase
MIEVIFPDGSKKSFEKGIIALEIIGSISPSLKKKSLIAEFNGQPIDLSDSINESGKIRFILNDDKEALDVIRHDAAHLLAQAVQELYKDVQVTIGPVIEDGFYYDFATKKPFHEEDLQKIEKHMLKLAKRGDKIKKEIWQRDKAVKFFKDKGEFYKAEIIEAIPANEDIKLYFQGDFVDLCRGPHALSTSVVKHFKLLKVAGAYWRGDSNNEMLQRIYGTAWQSKEQLDKYLFMIEEAKKRDHRRLGKDLGLFHIQEEATGSIFWHKKGAILYKIIENYLAKKLQEYDYFQVKTPLLLDRVLWEKSGHWDKFRENMFIAESEGRHLALKPMNCPGHVQIYNKEIRSYRDLPLRMAEFGCCHRNEPSGALHGLMRVRSFVQDDAHIFCTKEQICQETENFTKLLLDVYKDFGFTDVKVKYADRPERRAGDDKIWDEAEGSLLDAIKSMKLDYTVNPGEGAFYGPKIEFVLTDALGRDWQCGTLQVDFVLPERLDAKFTDHDGKIKRPVMLHRAILGSFERFIGILIENYAGKFPLWLAPTQLVLASVVNDVDDYVEEIFQTLKEIGVRAEKDITSEKIGYKIRKYSEQKIPMILVIGKNEAEKREVNIRSLGSTEQKILSLDDFVRDMRKEVFY